MSGIAQYLSGAIGALPTPSADSSSADDREAIARIAALHGLGTESGLHHRGPPNSSWTREEWEQRILGCVPEHVEKQCYALADQIIALRQSHCVSGEGK